MGWQAFGGVLAARSWARKPVQIVVGLVAATALLTGYQVATPSSAAAAPSAAPLAAEGLAAQEVAAAAAQPVTADPLPTVQIDGIVYAQAVAGNRVFAGGEFANARPAGAAPGSQLTPRSNLLSYNLQTGVLDGSFAPQVNGRIMAAAVSPDASTLYIGGSFTAVNGQARFRLAAFSTATGALLNWQPGTNSAVFGIAATNSAVYFAGQYTTVNNATRTGVAAVTASTGSLLPFNPVHEGGYLARAVVVSPDGSKVIAAGSFLTTNGQSEPGRGMAALDAATGASLPWAVNSVIRNAGTNAAIYSLASDATSVYGSGYDFGGSRTLDGFEGAFRAAWSDGTMAWMQDCHGDSYSVAPQNGILYVASHSHYCGNIGEFPQAEPWQYNHSLAFAPEPSGRAITPDIYGYRSFTGNPAGKLLHWYPTWGPGTVSGLSQAAWSVAAAGNYVLYGGEFVSINGTRQQGLVRFATRDIAPNKVGPRVQGGAWKIYPVSFRPGEARISWQANHDPDSTELTYQLFRQGVTAPLRTETAASTNWARPTMRFTDTTVQPGQTYQYRVRATDANGNTTQSDWTSVTIASPGSTPAYMREVLDDDPRHYWPLGESSGTTGADWAGADSLTLSAGTSRSADGQALDGSTNATVFTGASTSYASTGIPQEGPQQYSVEAWFRTTSTQGGKIVGFGNRASGSSSRLDRHIYISGTGVISFGNRPSQTRVVQSGAGFNDGKWHHVVGTLGPDGMTLWVDGERIGTRADTTSAQVNFGYWRVGGDSLSGWPSANGTYLNGSIADVAVYDRVLTGAEVNAHIVASGRPSTLPPDPNQAPTAAFTPTATGLVLDVDASASSDPEGPIASYAWEFGDGATGTGAAARHTYAAGGTYTVKLTVTDAAGATATAVRSVTVAAANAAPTSSFTASSDGLAIAVDGRASSDPDGTIASYAWSFGDGTTGTGATATHTYPSSGTRTVSLTVTDDRGATATSSQQVTVTAANQSPTASFTVTQQGMTVSVDGRGSSDPDGAIAAYAWSFGDGTTASGATASHTYTAEGAHTIALTVVDDAGTSATTTRSVTVQQQVPAEVLARDTFTRSATSSWGAPDVGPAWTTFYGNPAFSVSGDQGRMALAPSQTREARMTTLSRADAQVDVSFSSDVASAGGAASVTVIGRQVGSSVYATRVRLEPGGVIRVYLLYNETSLGSFVLPQSYTPGAVVNVRMLVDGTSPTRLAASVWLAGIAEPGTWMLDTTNSIAAMQAAGTVGVRGAVSSVSTVPSQTIRFDDWSVRAVR